MSTFGDFITAFELMNKFSVDLTEKFHGEKKLPFKGNYYCLVPQILLKLKISIILYFQSLKN